MAGRLASEIVPHVLDKLGSPAFEDLGEIFGWKDKHRRLKNTLSTINAVLIDAEKIRPRSDDINAWLEAVEEIASYIDDLLDLRWIEGSSDLAQKVELICCRLDEIALKQEEFHFEEFESRAEAVRLQGNAQVSEIIGRDEDRKRIIENLKASVGCGTHEVPIMAIGGVSGIGKTTLAQSVYEDPEIVRMFELRLWVSVSCKFDSAVMNNIIESVSERLKCRAERYNSSKLRGLLGQRSFLLVLDSVDDVCVEDQQQWHSICDIYEKDSARAIIITTPYPQLIRSSIQHSDYYVLKGLGQDDSWSLFLKCAFGDGKEKDHPLLVEIGKSMIQKSMGVPLAVMKLGRRLRDNREYSIWMQITESDDPFNIFSATKKSFDTLPIAVKSRIVLCAAFMKGSLVSREDMIDLWVANGVSRSVHEGYTDFQNFLSSQFFRFPSAAATKWRVKQIAEECNQIPRWHFPAEEFNNNLVDHSELAQLRVFKGYDLSLEFVEIPDMVYDLAAYAAKKEIAIVKFNELSGKEFPSRLLNASMATTLVFSEPVGTICKSLLERLLSRFKFLRALMLNGALFEELPDVLGDLEHLRLLHLCRNYELKMLPDSVCKLVELETLDFRHCDQLEMLPTYVFKLVKLRSLTLTCKIRCFPESDLQCWDLLEQLQIVGCANLEYLTEYIGSLHSLSRLAILKCHKLLSLPNSMRNLAKLSELIVHNCEKLDLTTWKGLDGLKRIDCLSFSKLPRLLEFPDGIKSAQSLRYLMIYECPEFQRLPEDLRHCKNLWEMILVGCNKLSALPMGIFELELRNLQISGCPELIARCKRDSHEWPLLSRISTIFLDDVVINNGHHIRQHASLPYHLNLILEQAPVTVNHRAGPSGERYDQRMVDNPISTTRVLTLVEDRTVVPDLYDMKLLEDRQRKPYKMDDIASSSLQDGVPVATKGIESSSGVCEELIKSCTSIFFLLSEDYEFEKDTLIQLWMAGGTVTNEVDGESCFNYFLKKECIFCYETNFVTGVDSYKMNIYEINHKLERQGDESRFYLKWGNGNQNAMCSEIKHVSLVCDDTDIAAIIQVLLSSKELKTLIFLGDYGKVTQVPDHLFLGLEELHVLDLSRTRIEKVPSSIRCMAHLRYLDLSWTPIKHLPDTVCFLNELQTLKLEGCSNLRRLPEQIKLLTTLRHLHIDVLRQLAVMPRGVGNLENLRTLSAFMVGTKEGGCKITELKKLNNLTGNFCIAMLEHVKGGDEASEAALSRKNQIRKLELKWSISHASKIGFAVLDALRPCTSLEELKISCYGGSKFPSWISNPNFNRLVCVSLFDCGHLLDLPPLERLPFLKYLSLVKMNRIKKISRLMNTSRVAFSKLKKLSIIEMAALETWNWKEENAGDFKCLVELIISKCPELREMGVLRYISSAGNLEISECSKLKLPSDKKLPGQGGEDRRKIEHLPNKEIGPHHADADEVIDHEGSDEINVTFPNASSLPLTRGQPPKLPRRDMSSLTALRPNKTRSTLPSISRSVNPARSSFMMPTTSSKMRGIGASVPSRSMMRTTSSKMRAIGPSAPHRSSGSMNPAMPSPMMRETSSKMHGVTSSTRRLFWSSVQENPGARMQMANPKKFKISSFPQRRLLRSVATSSRKLDKFDSMDRPGPPEFE